MERRHRLLNPMLEVFERDLRSDQPRRPLPQRIGERRLRQQRRNFFREQLLNHQQRETIGRAAVTCIAHAFDELGRRHHVPLSTAPVPAGASVTLGPWLLPTIISATPEATATPAITHNVFATIAS